MKFRDLSNIDFPRLGKEQSIKHLKNECSIDAPDAVIEQFYVDHSDKDEFQKLYGEVDLNTIEWELVEIPTEELLNLGNSATHPDFILEVSEDASHYIDIGDEAINCRESDLVHWKQFGSWFTPPVFIKGEVLGKPDVYLHLVEGHTRLGHLLGLTKYKVFRVAKVHKAYLGQLKVST